MEWKRNLKHRAEFYAAVFRGHFKQRESSAADKSVRGNKLSSGGSDLLFLQFPHVINKRLRLFCRDTFGFEGRHVGWLFGFLAIQNDLNKIFILEFGIELFLCLLAVTD